MSIHRYPLSSLLLDALRSVAGLAATLGPLAFLDVVWPLTLILLALGLVFFIFAIRLVLQSLSSIELSDEGIASRGLFGRTMNWPELTSLKLAHYGVPRRPSEGWYQLTIKGGGCVLKLDSTIDGFDDIVSVATRAANVRGVVFDPATGENLKSVGCLADRDSVLDS